MKTTETSPTVLVVNDDPNVLGLLTVLLEHEGYRTVTADCGERALELALSSEPDIIISDVVMPEVDGIEVCRRLKRDARTASIPVLLASAIRQSGKDNLEGLNAGADDYIEMPCRRQELLVKVARLAERHRVEKHYRELVEQTADIIFTRDLDGYVKSINEAGARFFGRPASEIVGLHLAQLIGDEEAADNIEKARRHASDEPIRKVVCVEDARGETHYLDWMIMVVRDVQGNATGARGVARDITEQWLAQEAMRESEARYRALVEQSSDGIFLIDPADKRILEANPAYQQMLGYSAEELKGLTLYDVAHSERKIINWNVERVLAKGDHVVGERQHRRKDGSLVDVEVTVKRLSYGGKEVICTTARDLTERKRAQAEMQTSEAEMRALFAAMTDVILVLDAEGRCRKIAPTNPDLLFKPPDEVVGKRLHEIFPGEQAEKFSGFVARALESGRPVDVEYDLTIKGRQVWFSGTVSPMPGDCVVLVARDITERKHAEDALAQQAEREALINRISNAVRRSLDAEEVFRTAVREIGMHLDVDRCSLFLLDRGANLVRNAAEYDAQGVAPAGRDYPLSLVEELVKDIREQGVLTYDDAAADERIGFIYHNILRKVGTRSIMYVAIRVGDETPACFAISTSRAVRRWSEADVDVARAVAVQTGLAIRQAELYQKAEATSSREALINRLSLSIRASLSLPEVLGTTTRELGRALNASRVTLYLHNPERDEAAADHEYVAPHAASARHLKINFDSPIGQRLLRSAQPIVIDDALNYANGGAEYDLYVRSHAARFGLRSQINCPLVVNGRFRGALCIHQTDRVRHWTEDEVALVQAVASQLATGIAQAELFEMTRRAKKEWETTF
ncbi:MAG TPA: PAS domain S-box protein, partial [Pyrinomonadaceae bacterium]